MHPKFIAFIAPEVTAAAFGGAKLLADRGSQLLAILTRRSFQNLLQRTPILPIFGFVIAAAAGRAMAEEAAKMPAPNPQGVEHVLYLTIKADPASPLLAQANGQPTPAKFLVTVRISAHSVETNFFGFVPVTVPEFDLTKGLNDQLIWRDGKCHHERGYPKITVTGVDGLVTSGQDKHLVAARWRQLGLFLPRDEVLASKRLDNGSDKVGSYLATRTETKQSRLLPGAAVRKRAGRKAR